MTGSYEFFVGGGVAAFDCDEDGLPGPLPRRWLAAGRPLSATTAPTAVRCRFERRSSEATDLTEVTGAYPLDIDGDGHDRPRRPARGEDVLLRGLGDCASSAPTRPGASTAADDWTTAFSATWEPGEHLADAGLRRLHRPRDDDGHLALCASEPLSCGRRATASASRRPRPSTPGRCALSMLFSDWDRSGRRDLRVSNDQHYYYDDGEEQLWRMTPGEAPRLYARDGGLGASPASGGWASPARTSPVTAIPEVYLTSIGSNRARDARRWSATTRRTRTSPHDRGVSVDARRAIGEPIYPSTSWHPEFDDVNNDGRSTSTSPRATSTPSPTTPREDPNELFLGLPDGTFRSGRRDGSGILDTLRTRGAALVGPQRRRPARPRRGPSRRERHASGATSASGRGRPSRRRWVTGSA